VPAAADLLTACHVRADRDEHAAAHEMRVKPYSFSA
jgi:hypothetical protein